MQIRVGAYSYRVEVNNPAKPLYHEGVRVVGLTLWEHQQILICGTVPPGRREEVLFHEALEAWKFHTGMPKEKEDLIDWSVTVRKSVERDLADAGGLAALMAMQPTAEHASAAPADETSLLRRNKFPGLDDEQFATAQAMWRSAGLDPWSEQFHVRLVWDSVRKAQVPKLILNIEGIRARAHATGQYAGNDEPEHLYMDDGRAPTKCTFTVKRIVNGREAKFVAAAMWDEYFGNDPERWPDVVAQFPRVCLERCAEALALRRAFPEVRDVYTPEEFIRQDRQHRAAAKSYPSPQPMQAEQLEEHPIQIPQSSQGLHLALIDLGFKTPAQRESLMREVSREMDRRDGDDAIFRERVIRRAMERGGKTTEAA